jgi:putative membrane protein
MNFQKKFSENDLARIKQSVFDAESKISGEIVPVIVSRSGHYTIANYKGSLFAAAFTFLSIVFIDRYVPTYAIYDPLLIFFAVVLVGALGALATHYSDMIKRMLIGQQYMDRATYQRAETSFLEEQVFNTRQRTGIMIFISFFEHEVIVMADKGISQVVEQKEWDKLVKNLTDHIRDNKIVEGLEIAIKRCGEILLEKGFHKTGDDENELRDDLRVEQ